MRKQSNILGVLLGIFVVAIIVGGIYAFYQHERRNKGVALAVRIAELSPDRSSTPETIEGLRAAIAEYENAMDRYVQAAARTGTYWKILAIRLADKGMHKEALDALEKAVQYNAEEPVLYYLTGVSAVIVAKSSLDPVVRPGAKQSERDRYFSMAEGAFKRSIELEPAYAKSEYELGLLYMMELDQSADAVPCLERYHEMMPKSVDGMFALARAYYMTEDYRKSVALYDEILAVTKDAAEKAEAQQNRDYILGNMNG
jgi:tetratricopeptide (TPR) repeat protein